MAAYRLEVRVTDPEVEDAPEMPRWDDLDLTNMLGSFHEWMRFSLTDEQRKSVRWTLTPVRGTDETTPAGPRPRGGVAPDR